MSHEKTPPNFKVAIFGDSGVGRGFESVLELVKKEQADMVIHLEDFSYYLDHHYGAQIRIRVGDFRGDVINQNPFTTTLFEVGPGDIYHNYTGKKIILPNSLFLTTPVINESYGSKYVLHTFSIFLERTCDWRMFKKNLEKASHTVCSGFLDKAQSYFNTMAKKSGLEPPVATPTVTVGMSHLYSVELVVRIAAPFKQKGDLEQKILAMTFDEELDLQTRVK